MISRDGTSIAYERQGNRTGALATRWVALATGVLLLLFALAMTAALGIKAPLNYSVYSASAGPSFSPRCEDHRWAPKNLHPRRVSVL